VLDDLVDEDEHPTVTTQMHEYEQMEQVDNETMDDLSQHI